MRLTTHSQRGTEMVYAVVVLDLTGRTNGRRYIPVYLAKHHPGRKPTAKQLETKLRSALRFDLR